MNAGLGRGSRLQRGEVNLQSILDAAVLDCITNRNKKSQRSHLRYFEAFTKVVAINRHTFVSRIEPG